MDERFRDAKPSSENQVDYIPSLTNPNFVCENPLGLSVFAGLLAPLVVGDNSESSVAKEKGSRKQAIKEHLNIKAHIVQPLVAGILALVSATGLPVNNIGGHEPREQLKAAFINVNSRKERVSIGGR